jgi:hypothetical protein
MCDRSAVAGRAKKLRAYSTATSDINLILASTIAPHETTESQLRSSGSVAGTSERGKQEQNQNQIKGEGNRISYELTNRLGTM